MKRIKIKFYTCKIIRKMILEERKLPWITGRIYDSPIIINRNKINKPIKLKIVLK